MGWCVQLFLLALLLSVFFLLSSPFVRRADAVHHVIRKETGSSLAQSPGWPTVLISEDTLEIQGDPLEETTGDWTELCDLPLSYHLLLRNQQPIPSFALLNARLLSIRANHVTEIANGAFQHCTHLRNAAFPAAVRTATGAFAHCERLALFSLPALRESGDFAFAACHALKTAFLPSLTRLGDGTFEGCAQLENVTMPLAQVIGNSAFRGCKSLRSVSIPNTTAIGGQAFFGCRRLYVLELGRNAPGHIAGDAFGGMTGEELTLLVPDIASYLPLVQSFPAEASTRELRV